MKAAVIVGVVVVLAAIGGAFALKDKSKPANPTPDTSTSASAANTTTQNTEQKTTNTENVGENTISYTNDGFSPASLTVKAGTTITIKNNSSRVLQFSSDPHPVHTDDQELNQNSISPGKTGTFTATVKGTHGYHNHLNESHTGTLIVE